MRFDSIAEFPQKCSGCMACYNACPKDAIVMVEQDDGFLYPRIADDTCINCGLCGRVCTISDPHQKVNAIHTISAKAKDENVRMRGSSGGVFECIARRVIDNGGVVYGAAYDKENYRVAHFSSDDVSLSELLKSKYSQSYIGYTYSKVADSLRNGKTVLFVGTPCQVRGLKNYLSREKVVGNLILVDFMCHGVPSPGILQKTILQIEQQRGAKVTNVSFREKDDGWRSQVIKFYFEDGKIEKFTSAYYYYYYYFLNNYTLRDSCYSCEEYSSHTSDLTLADFWNVSAEEDDDKGISLVLVNTELGKAVLSEAEDFLYTKEIALPNTEIYSHKKYDYKLKQKFMSVYRRGGIHEIQGTFYRKQVKKNKCKRRIRCFLGACKGAVKRLFKGVRLKK